MDARTRRHNVAAENGITAVASNWFKRMNALSGSSSNLTRWLVSFGCFTSTPHGFSCYGVQFESSKLIGHGPEIADLGS